MKSEQQHPLRSRSHSGNREVEWSKGFNTIGADIMENPGFEGSKVFLPYCSDDGEAKSTVHRLATELGFDAFDAGHLRQARLLEPFALLWISIAFGSNRRNRDFGLAMLRRSAA